MSQTEKLHILVVELNPAADQAESVPVEYVDVEDVEDLMGKDTANGRAERRSLNSWRPDTIIGFQKRHLASTKEGEEREGKRMVFRTRWL